MNKQTTQQKVQELNDDGITFDRFNDKLVIHNNNQEYLISDNVLEVIIQHGIKKQYLMKKTYLISSENMKYTSH